MPRPSSRTARPLLGAAAAALLVLAGACGDDDDDDAAADTEPAAATAEAPATTEVAAATSEAAATTEPGGATTLPASDYPMTPATSSDAGTTATTTGSSGGAAAGGGTVAIAESSLGPILVDGEGMTLYMFVPDDRGPSTCEDACLEAWPALAGPVTAGDGVDASLLATAARPDDGSEQATCNGWPLYTFVQDAAPGDVNGQGANDVWFVLDATCTPVGMP